MHDANPIFVGYLKLLDDALDVAEKSLDNREFFVADTQLNHVWIYRASGIDKVIQFLYEEIALDERVKRRELLLRRLRKEAGLLRLLLFKIA